MTSRSLIFITLNFQPKWHLYIKPLKKKTCQCPGGPVVRTLALPRAWIQSLVGELSSPQAVRYGQKEIFFLFFSKGNFHTSKVKWFAGPMEKQRNRESQTFPGLGPWTVCACVCLCVYMHMCIHTLSHSPPGSSVHGIFQARILEQDAILSFIFPTWRDCVSCTGSQILYHWAAWEATVPWTSHCFLQTLPHVWNEGKVKVLRIQDRHSP